MQHPFSMGASPVRDRFMLELASATQRLEAPLDKMQTTARLLAEQLAADRCAYAIVEDERVFDITGDYHRGVPSIVGRWPVAAFGPECVRCMLAGEPYVVHDTHQHPHIDASHRAAYDATSIRAVVCVPLHRDGKFSAAMAVHQQRPRVWTPDEVELVTAVVVSCWESLERARIDRSLRDSEARFRSMVDASPDGVHVLSEDGVLLQVSRAGLVLLEADCAEQVLGKSLAELVVPEHEERYLRFSESVRCGEPESAQCDLVGLRGTRRTVELTGSRLVSPGGVVSVLAVARDVTARVLSERALSQSRARLDYAVRLSGVGFWYCDLPFDTLQWDERVKAHFFLPPDARVTIDTFYERIHPDDREATRAAIAHSIATRIPYDMIYRTTDPAGQRVKWIRALGGTAYGEDGAPTHFDGVTVDVTDEQLRREHLTRLNARLREEERRKDAFLATLAHELRNPLAPMRAGLAVWHEGTDPAQREKVRVMMERQLTHLVHLVDDLLDLSRVTHGKLHLRRERVELAAVMEQALEVVRLGVERARHTLVVELPELPLWLHADRTRVAQMIENLLSNAVKYTPEGGTITVRAASCGSSMALSITDSGIGLAPDMVAAVFEPFVQVGNSLDRSSGGLGIGLTLVRHLAELHGGSVHAHSQGLGQGSTFTLLLPLADPVVEPVAPTPQVPQAERPLRVLVVDDNEDAAEMLAMMLEMRGHVPRVAHDGPSAIALARELHPELAFLDIGLPGMNGYELAAQLRQEPELGACYLVALTGWGSDDDRGRATQAGFDEHFVKPFDRARMHALLAARARA